MKLTKEQEAWIEDFKEKTGCDIFEIELLENGTKTFEYIANNNMKWFRAWHPNSGIIFKSIPTTKYRKKLEIIQDCKVCGGHGTNPDNNKLCYGCGGDGEIKSIISVKSYKDLNNERSNERISEMIKLHFDQYEKPQLHKPLTEGSVRHQTKPYKESKSTIESPPAPKSQINAPGISAYKMDPPFTSKPKTMVNTYEPDPKPGVGDMWEEVIKDMKERRQLGIDKYGTPLQAFNGRNSLVDAYQEILDLVVYLRTSIEENRNLDIQTKIVDDMEFKFIDPAVERKLRVKAHPIDVEGLWTAHEIKIELFGRKYVLYTKKAVKGFNIPVLVHYKDGTWTAETERGTPIEITKITEVISE